MELEATSLSKSGFLSRNRELTRIILLATHAKKSPYRRVSGG